MADARFQQPPQQYSYSYFSQLVRDLTQQFSSILTPSITTVGSLIFIPPPTGIPTNGSGQPVGTVYVDVDTLKLVLANVAYVSSSAIVSSLGTVIATGH